MRVISLKTVINRVLDKKILLLACIVLFTILGAALGYKQTKGAAESAQKDADVYQQDLVEYDAMIATLEANLETNKTQYDKQKEYCDNSIYMKLDSNMFYMGEVQYSLSEDAGETLRDSIYAYLTSNDFRNKIVEKIGDISVGYFKEIYYVGYSGNLITIDASHYDKAEATRYLEAIMKCVEETNYDLTVLNSSTSDRADTGVLNNQNTQKNNLKMYTSNVSDTQTQLSNKKQDKDKYMAENAAAPMDKKAKLKGIIKFALVGAIFGFVAMFGLVILKILYGSKLEADDYLEQNKINIIANLNDKEFDPQRAALDIDIVLGQKGIDKVCIGTLLAQNLEKDTLKPITKELESFNRKTVVDETQLNDVEALKTFAAAKTVVLAVKYNETKYSQIDKYLNLCQRYNIEVIGAIVL